MQRQVTRATKRPHRPEKVPTHSSGPCWLKHTITASSSDDPFCDEPPKAASGPPRDDPTSDDSCDDLVGSGDSCLCVSSRDFSSRFSRSVAGDADGAPSRRTGFLVPSFSTFLRRLLSADARHCSRSCPFLVSLPRCAALAAPSGAVCIASDAKGMEALLPSVFASCALCVRRKAFRRCLEKEFWERNFGHHESQLGTATSPPTVAWRQAPAGMPITAEANTYRQSGSGLRVTPNSLFPIYWRRRWWLGLRTPAIGGIASVQLYSTVSGRFKRVPICIYSLSLPFPPPVAPSALFRAQHKLFLQSASFLASN